MTAKPQARCMYCEAPNVTKAHVFAESYTKLFDDPYVNSDHVVRHDYTDPKTGDKRVLKRAASFALKVRKVCGDCNSGWLSQLEEDVRPTLKRFAENDPFLLDAREQATLALWAFCAALHGIAMTASDDEHFASPELAREVFATRCPPAGTQVWLGANGHGEMAWFGSHSLNLPPGLSDAQAFGASLSFGYANLHLIFHGVTDRRIQMRYDLHRAFKQIWPVRGEVRWPPPLITTDRDLTPIALMIDDSSSWVAD